jgi:hypothetical protein
VGLELSILALIPGLGNLAWREAVLSQTRTRQRYAAYELMIAGDANHGTPDDADAACADIRSTRSGAVGDRARQGTASPIPRVPPEVCTAEVTRRG